MTTRHAQSHPSFYTPYGGGRHGSRGGVLPGYRDWHEHGIGSSIAGSGGLGGAGGSSAGDGRGSSMMIAGLAGNMAHMSDSVILDIGESSSSSSSSSKLNVAGNVHDDDDELAEDELSGAALDAESGSNDWEVQMLAAEMERQERKRGHSLSDNLGELRHCSTFLRRRRKLSDTETECSETDGDERLASSGSATVATDVDATLGVASGSASGSTRPRASSLDQFNLRYGIGRGIFKAMSIDRDKDKL